MKSSRTPKVVAWIAIVAVLAGTLGTVVAALLLPQEHAADVANIAGQ